MISSFNSDNSACPINLNGIPTMYYEYRICPPGIRTVRFKGRGYNFEYRIAIPQLTFIYYSDELIGAFIAIKNKLFSPISCQGFYPISPSDALYTTAESFWELLFVHDEEILFPVNKDFVITSFKQWEELTEQNPNFMEEEFDPQDCPFCNIRFISENKDHSAPTWMAMRSLIGNMQIMKHPVRTRTIRYYSDHFSICMPEIHLVYEPATKQLLCLTRIPDGDYIPFCLPNVNPFGFVCLGDEFNWHTNWNINPFDYFWNSSFNQSWEIRVPINKEFGVISIRHWDCLTRKNPNLFRDQYDPVFASKSYPVRYRFDSRGELATSFSWRFCDVGD